jgi:hypothetical protein
MKVCPLAAFGSFVSRPLFADVMPLKLQILQVGGLALIGALT